TSHLQEERDVRTEGGRVAEGQSRRRRGETRLLRAVRVRRVELLPGEDADAGGEVQGPRRQRRGGEGIRGRGEESPRIEVASPTNPTTHGRQSPWVFR